MYPWHKTRTHFKKIIREYEQVLEIKYLTVEIKNLTRELEGEVKEIFPKAEQKDRDEVIRKKTLFRREIQEA